MSTSDSAKVVFSEPNVGNGSDKAPEKAPDKAPERAPDKAPESMWDTRYKAEEYAYGEAPNDFLAACVSKLPGSAAGRALCLAEGEGRNAVFLSRHGWTCHCLDLSSVGLAKAQQLAGRFGVTLETEVCDLATVAFPVEQYDVVTSIWCHLPPDVRRRVHAEVVKTLKPGGVLVLEAYRPKQLEYKTGGPPSLPMLMTLELLREELAGLELIHAVELDREIHEGVYHNGMSAVVQVLARKPSSIPA